MQQTVNHLQSMDPDKTAIAECLIKSMSSVFHVHVDLRTTAWRNLSQVGVELLSGDIIRGNIFDDEKRF